MFLKKKAKRFRLVEKNGVCLVVSEIPTKEKIFGYIGDSFTGYVDMQWRYHFLFFFGTFFLSWNVMGLIWSSTSKSEGNAGNLCLEQASGLTEIILFSYETQSTVGYGYRYIVSACNAGGYILQFLQIFLGVLLPPLLGGVIFLKSRRPDKSYKTVIFSKVATIFDESSLEPGTDEIQCKQKFLKKTRRFFQFRVGNLRQSHIVSTSIRVILVKDRHTNEGETIPFCMHQLPICTLAVGFENVSENPELPFLTWPVVVTHEIKEDSPLKDVEKLVINYEIIVLLEGVIEPTGKPTQLRTSYTPDEIRWQHKFAPIVMEYKSRGEKEPKDVISVDYSTFDQIIPLHRAFSQEEVITKSELPSYSS